MFKKAEEKDDNIDREGHRSSVGDIGARPEDIATGSRQVRVQRHRRRRHRGTRHRSVISRHRSVISRHRSVISRLFGSANRSLFGSQNVIVTSPIHRQIGRKIKKLFTKNSVVPDVDRARHSAHPLNLERRGAERDFASFSSYQAPVDYFLFKTKRFGRAAAESIQHMKDEHKFTHTSPKFWKIVQLHIVDFTSKYVMYSSFFNFVHMESEQELSVNLLFTVYNSTLWHMLAAFLSCIVGYLADSCVGTYIVVVCVMELRLINTMMFFLLNLPYFEEVLKLKEWVTLISSYASYMASVADPVKTTMILEQYKLPDDGNRVLFACGRIVWSRELATVGSFYFLNYFIKTKFASFAFNVIDIVLLSTNLVILFHLKKKLTNSNFKYMFLDNVYKCSFSALKQKYYSEANVSRDVEPEHWVDYASWYPDNIRQGAKAFFAIVLLILTLYVFFSINHLLYHVLDAQIRRMGGDFKKIFYLPNVVKVGILNLLNIPFYLWIVYPMCLKSVAFFKSDVKLLGVAYISLGLSLLSFFGIQYVLENQAMIHPKRGYAQLRIYNALPTKTAFHCKWTGGIVIGSGETFAKLAISTMELTYTTAFVLNRKANLNYSKTIFIFSRESVSYVISRFGLIRMQKFDPILTGPLNTISPEIARVTFFNTVSNLTHLTFKSVNTKTANIVKLPRYDERLVRGFQGDSYVIIEMGDQPQSFRGSGIYTIVVYEGPNGGIRVRSYTIMEPTMMSPLWTLGGIYLASVALSLQTVVMFRLVYTRGSPGTRCVLLGILHLLTSSSDVLIHLNYEVWHLYVDSIDLFLYLCTYITNGILFLYACIRLPIE